jgi:hypothetical protein
MRQRLLAACVALAAMLAATSAGAELLTWNAATDFSISNGNPNGAWSYGGLANLHTSTFQAFTAFNSLANGSCPEWYVAADGRVIWKNTTASSAYGVAPGQLSLQPGSNQQPSVVRWTAPNTIGSTSVDVQGQFYPGDTGTMLVGIFVNGIGSDNVPRWSANNSGSFDFTVPVGPGNTIDFAVYGGYAFGNTPLSATITTIPEPSAIILLTTGLFGTLLYARRRRMS